MVDITKTYVYHRYQEQHHKKAFADSKGGFDNNLELVNVWKDYMAARFTGMQTITING